VTSNTTVFCVHWPFSQNCSCATPVIGGQVVAVYQGKYEIRSEDVFDIIMSAAEAAATTASIYRTVSSASGG